MSGVKETRRRSGALKHKRLSDLATDGQNTIKRVTAAANLRRRVKVHDAQSSERYPSEWLVTPGEPGFTAYAMVYGTSGRAKASELEQFEVIRVSQHARMARVHAFVGINQFHFNGTSFIRRISESACFWFYRMGSFRVV